MYETMFGLSRRPFSATPDSDCCAGVETMQKAFDDLCAFVDQGEGIALLTAPSGNGKTLLCQRLASECQKDFRTACLANGNFETRRSLLQAVLYELGRPYMGLDEQELRLELTSAVNAAIRKTRGVFLIVDEAHLAHRSVLDEIRSMTNLTRHGSPLVRVMLSAQLQFEETLAAPEFDAFNQRIRAHVTLEPISRQESMEYIEFRLAWAGAALTEVFRAEATELIARVCDGIPRCINQLCDHCLLLAFAAGERPVGRSIVEQALDDLKRLPLQWQLPESMLDEPGRLARPDSAGTPVATARQVVQSEAERTKSNDNNFEFEVGAGIEIAAGTIEIAGTSNAPSAFGESAVFEVGASTSAESPVKTSIVNSPENSTREPSKASSSKAEAPLSQESQASVSVVQRPAEADSRKAKSPSAGTEPTEMGKTRDRRKQSVSSPSQSFWTSFEAPTFVEESVHILATNRTVGTASAAPTSPSPNKDEVVLDRYAAIDAVTERMEKKRKLSNSSVSQAKDPKPALLDSKRETMLAVGSGSKQQEREAATSVASRASIAATVDFAGDDIILAVEEEIVDLVRETSQIARGKVDEQMIENLKVSASERLRRASQQVGRSAAPQYDVIQPVEGERRRTNRADFPVLEKPGNRSDESTASDADDRSQASQARYSQLFSDLRRSRRSG